MKTGRPILFHICKPQPELFVFTYASIDCEVMALVICYRAQSPYQSTVEICGLLESPKPLQISMVGGTKFDPWR